MPAKLRSRPKTVSPKSTPDFARNIPQKTRPNGPIYKIYRHKREKIGNSLSFFARIIYYR